MESTSSAKYLISLLFFAFIYLIVPLIGYLGLQAMFAGKNADEAISMLVVALFSGFIYLFFSMLVSLILGIMASIFSLSSKDKGNLKYIMPVLFMISVGVIIFSFFNPYVIIAIYIINLCVLAILFLIEGVDFMKRKRKFRQNSVAVRKN